MQVLGSRAARAFNAELDIAEWANACALNPARLMPSQRDEPAVRAAASRLGDVSARGMERMAQLAGFTE